MLKLLDRCRTADVPGLPARCPAHPGRESGQFPMLFKVLSQRLPLTQPVDQARALQSPAGRVPRRHHLAPSQSEKVTFALNYDIHPLHFAHAPSSTRQVSVSWVSHRGKVLTVQRYAPYGPRTP